jgi:putative Mg2+ transporter-C (MgtC) family protein
MAFTDIALRLAVAAICGGVIGFERENQQKPAGLRTHMLVAIGSAAFTLAALNMDPLESLNGEGSRIQVDPSRVIQGIAGGIGFLGAGSIFRSNGSVQGLTTAATIWVVGAVGICSGVGNYALAAITSVLVVLIAGTLGIVESWLFSHAPSAPVSESQESTNRKTASETPKKGGEPEAPNSHGQD